MIDPKRPVETTEDQPRICRTIGVLERVEGVVTLLLSVPYRGRDGSAEVEVNLNGDPVNRHGVGSGLGFRNVPVVSSGFYPLGQLAHAPYGRGMITLWFAKNEYPDSLFFVEIISTDGKPTEAKLHVR